MILEYARKCERNMLISTVVMLVLGMVLSFEPDNSIKVLTGLIAGLFIVIGIVQLIDYLRQGKMERMTSISLVLGVILIGVGIFLFVNINSLAKFITLLIGLSIMIKGLFKLQYALNIKSVSDKWLYNLIVAFFNLVLGVVLLFNPWDSAVLFLRIVGIILAVASVLEFLETLMVMKTLDNAKELPFVEKETVEEDK